MLGLEHDQNQIMNSTYEIGVIMIIVILVIIITILILKYELYK